MKNKDNPSHLSRIASTSAVNSKKQHHSDQLLDSVLLFTLPPRHRVVRPQHAVEALVSRRSTLGHWLAADGARHRRRCVRGNVALQDALKARLAEGVATRSPHCVPRKLKAQGANIIVVLHHRRR